LCNQFPTVSVNADVIDSNEYSHLNSIFDQLPQTLTSPIDCSKYVVDTDASNHSISAVLQQFQKGELKVIAYASRCLSDAKKNYCTTRKELLAVIFALKTFRVYLLSSEPKFDLRTDHACLRSLLCSPEPTGQEGRRLDVLAEFSFNIIHRAGRLHSNADSLSRLTHCIRVDNANACKQYTREKLYDVNVKKRRRNV
jgi:hypothetical protein